jgi:predicted NBD/HSP70 family sugar kinase
MHVATVAAERDYMMAQEIDADAGANLDIIKACLANLSNPSMVIIGGGVSKLRDFLLDLIRTT